MVSITNHMPTSELQALDAAHHMHPFTHGSGLAGKGARIITRANGAWLTDSDGNRILDAMAGLWCVNIGYGRKELAQAAARQMEELPYYNTFFQTTHVPAIALSKKLAELAPEGFNHTFFAGSGSEANDTNLRLVRTYWAEKGQPERNIVISRWNAYHGSSVGSGSLGGMKGMHMQGGLPIPDIHHIDQPNWWAEGGDMTPEEFGLERARQLEAAIEELGPERVAAFIAEPIQGAGGVIVPPDTYWPEIQRIVDKYGILLIADEVICGFGRTGNWFGSQTMNIRPHIMTIAKGLSSGYQPIGGSIICDEVAGKPAYSRRGKDRRQSRHGNRALPQGKIRNADRSPAGGRSEDRRHDGLDRSDAGQGIARGFRSRGGHRWLHLSGTVFLKQPRNAPCRRPYDHFAASGHCERRDRHADRARVAVAGRMPREVEGRGSDEGPCRQLDPNISAFGQGMLVAFLGHFLVRFGLSVVG